MNKDQILEMLNSENGGDTRFALGLLENLGDKNLVEEVFKEMTVIYYESDKVFHCHTQGDLKLRKYFTFIIDLENFPKICSVLINISYEILQ